MTTEDDFHKALDANPEDHHTRLVFADFLQEHGDPRAEGYRALGLLQKSPNLNDDYHYRWHRKGEETNHSIPEDWWKLGEKGNNMFPFLRGTRQTSDDNAALAFSKLPHERRQEILGQQSEKLSRRARFSRRLGRYYRG